MQELCEIDPAWDGRFLMLREPEGWYGVAVYSARRQVPVLLSDDDEEVIEELQYRSSLVASKYILAREYIYVPHAAEKTVRYFGAEYDPAVRSWYVPDDLHNLVNTDLDMWRDRTRLEFLRSMLSEEKSRLKETSPDKRLYLKVPVSEKVEVQLRGAVYDSRKRAWYIDAMSPQVRFARWIPRDVEVDFTPEPMLLPDETLMYPMWLFIPTEDQEKAQMKGAIQCQVNGLWFAPIGSNPDVFDEWDVPRRYGPKFMFTEFLKKQGFDEERNDKVVPDQQTHTFFVEGDEEEPSGKYCLFMKDGELPGGWASNARINSYRRWSYPYFGLDFEFLR